MAIIQVCRICLQTDIKMFDLTSSNRLLIFMDLSGIADMGMHHHVCYICWEMLRKFEIFRKKCLISDEILSSSDLEFTKADLKKIQKEKKLSSSYFTFPPEIVAIDATVVKTITNINDKYGTKKIIATTNLNNTINKNAVVNKIANINVEYDNTKTTATTNLNNSINKNAVVNKIANINVECGNRKITTETNINNTLNKNAVVKIIANTNAEYDNRKKTAPANFNNTINKNAVVCLIANTNLEYGNRKITDPANLNIKNKVDAKKVDIKKAMEALTFSEWVSSLGGRVINVTGSVVKTNTDLPNNRETSNIDLGNSSSQHLSNDDFEEDSDDVISVIDTDCDDDESEIISETSAGKLKENNEKIINLNITNVIAKVNLSNDNMHMKKITIENGQICKYDKGNLSNNNMDMKKITIDNGKICKYDPLLNINETKLTNYKKGDNEDNVQSSSEIISLVNKYNAENVQPVVLNKQQNSIHLNETIKGDVALNDNMVNKTNVGQNKQYQVRPRVSDRKEFEDHEEPETPFMLKVFQAKLKLNQNYDIKTMTPEEVKLSIEARKESNNYMHNPYKCDFCYLGFMSKQTYENHISKHDPKIGPYECKFCHIRFPNKKNVDKHTSQVHITQYQCKQPDCDYTTMCRSRARCHIEFHKGKVYTCQHCEKTFKFFNTLAGHLRVAHPTFCCSTCGTTFHSKKFMTTHNCIVDNKATKDDAGKFCAECNFNFSSELAYKRHLVLSPKHFVRFGCKECGESFESKRDMSQHYSQAHDGKGEFTCTLCSKRFSSSRSFYHHMTVYHRNRSESMCEKCGRVLANKTSLVKHMQIHDDGQPKKQVRRPIKHNTPRIRCETCNQTYANKFAYRVHVEKHHQNVFRYNCVICDKVFYHRYLMKDHIKYVHMKEMRPKKHRIRRKINKEAKKEEIDHLHNEGNVAARHLNNEENIAEERICDDDNVAMEQICDDDNVAAEQIMR